MTLSILSSPLIFYKLLALNFKLDISLLEEIFTYTPLYTICTLEVVSNRIRDRLISKPQMVGRVLKKIYYIDEIQDFVGYKNIIYTSMHPVVMFFPELGDMASAYSITNKEKRQIRGPMKFPVASSHAFFPDGQVMLTGGFYDEYKPISTVWIITDDLEFLKGNPMNQERSYHASIYHGGYIYQLGGSGKQHCERYRNGIWNEIAGLIHGRKSAS